jgi:hypothetical protein
MGRAAGPGRKDNDGAAHEISSRVGCGKAFVRYLTVIEITKHGLLTGGR